MSKICTLKKRNLNVSISCLSYRGGLDSSRKIAAAVTLPRLLSALAEGLAVGALVLGGVHLVGAHQDLVQRAVVLVTAVMGALLDGALDALVCMTVHSKSLL